MNLPNLPQTTKQFQLGQKVTKIDFWSKVLYTIVIGILSISMIFVFTIMNENGLLLTADPITILFVFSFPFILAIAMIWIIWKADNIL